MRNFAPNSKWSHKRFEIAVAGRELTLQCQFLALRRADTLPKLVDRFRQTLQQKWSIVRTFCPCYRFINSEDKSLLFLNSNRRGKYGLATYSEEMSLLYCSREILPRTILAPNVRAMVDPYSEDIGSQMSSLYILYPRYRHFEILAPNFVGFWGHIAKTFCPHYRS